MFVGCLAMFIGYLGVCSVFSCVDTGSDVCVGCLALFLGCLAVYVGCFAVCGVCLAVF